MDADQSCCGNCYFPDDAWSEQFVDKEDLDTPFLPLDWRDLITLHSPPWAATSREGVYLVSLKPMREASANEIDRQARGFDVEIVSSVQAVVGDVETPPKQKAKEATDAVLKNVMAPIFHFKRKFKRGRPFMCCDDVDPLYPPGDPLYPGHAAYPSGHSTQAHGIAFFYAHLYPQLTDELFAAAAAIAKNREIAGLHYPSDSLAGKVLASQVVNLLFRNPKFRTLASEAAMEFPEHRLVSDDVQRSVER